MFGRSTFAESFVKIAARFGLGLKTAMHGAVLWPCITGTDGGFRLVGGAIECHSLFVGWVRISIDEEQLATTRSCKRRVERQSVLVRWLVRRWTLLLRSHISAADHSPDEQAFAFGSFLLKITSILQVGSQHSNLLAAG